MKKILPPLMLMALCGELLNAKPVSEHEAKNVALNYIHNKAKNSTKTKIKKFKVKKISADEKLLKKLFNEKGFEVAEPTFRLIELEPYGWVLVSGDDVNEPIIGYSLKENQKFDINSLPPQLEEILERYSIYTKEDREKNKTDKVNNEWNKLNKDTDEFESELNEETTDATTITYWKLTKDVDITTPLWNQDNYYNELPPLTARFLHNMRMVDQKIFQKSQLCCQVERITSKLVEMEIIPFHLTISKSVK